MNKTQYPQVLQYSFDRAFWNCIKGAVYCTARNLSSEIGLIVVVVEQQQVDKNKKVSVKKHGSAFCKNKDIILPITEEWEENKKKLMVIVRETYVVVSMKGWGGEETLRR